MASTKHIAIIGGGLAGPTLALSLKMQGINSTIYEARPVSYNLGNAIFLSANGMRVMDRIGLYESLKMKGNNYEQIQLMNKYGKSLGTAWNGNMDVYGYPAIRFRRSVLRAELLQHCSEQGIPIIYGKKLMSIKEREKCVSLQFEDGESAEFSVLVGADGIYSVVRDYLTPGYSPYYFGNCVIYGMMKREKLREKLKSWQEPGQVYALFGPEGSLIVAPTDYAADEVAYFFNLTLPNRSDEDWRKLKSDKEQLRQLLLAQYCGKGWVEIVDVLCRETPAEEFYLRVVNVLPDVPSWKSSSGRVIVLGDAAHAISPAAGQGGCVSLEDAEALSYVFALGIDSPSYLTALSKWETHRQERYQHIKGYTNLVLRLREQSPYRFVQYAKEWFLWAVSTFRGAKGYKWLYGYDANEFKSRL